MVQLARAAALICAIDSFVLPSLANPAGADHLKVASAFSRRAASNIRSVFSQEKRTVSKKRKVNSRRSCPAKGSSNTTNTPTNNGTTNGMVSMAWYAGWDSDYPVSSIPWTKYTHMSFSFAETTPDTSSVSLDNSGGASGLQAFVSAAHTNNVKALVTIGGWSGCRWYSDMVGSASNRTAFVSTVSSLITTYNLDGLDFDWEYPGTQGLGCNKVTAQDTDNFALFLAELRNKVGQNVTLTAATSLFPYVDSTGAQATNVTAFANSLDWINIMAYDVWGTFSTSFGPNAPLDDSCASAENQQGSGMSGVNKWHAAGFPYDQIVLGVPAYGRNATVTKANAFTAGSTTELASYPKFEAVQNVPALGLDTCGNGQPYAGELNYSDLVAAGVITQAGDAASGMIARWDNCSQTPFVYDPTTQQMYSYDNLKSLALKGAYVKQTGLRGFAIWEASGDGMNTDLLDALRTGSGMA